MRTSDLRAGRNPTGFSGIYDDIFDRFVTYKERAIRAKSGLREEEPGEDC